MNDFTTLANPCPLLPDSIALTPDEMRGLSFAQNYTNANTWSAEHMLSGDYNYYPLYGAVAWFLAYKTAHCAIEAYRNWGGQPLRTNEGFFRYHFNNAVSYALHPANFVNAVGAYANYVVNWPILKHYDDLTSFIRPRAQELAKSIQDLADKGNANAGGPRSWYHNYVLSWFQYDSQANTYSDQAARALSFVPEKTCALARSVQRMVSGNNEGGVGGYPKDHNPYYMDAGKKWSDNIDWHQEKIYDTINWCLNKSNTVKNTLVDYTSTAFSTLKHHYDHPEQLYAILDGCKEQLVDVCKNNPKSTAAATAGSLLMAYNYLKLPGRKKVNLAAGLAAAGAGVALYCMAEENPSVDAPTPAP